MIINQEILDELYLSAGSTRAEKAEKYVNSGNVNIKKVIYKNEKNFEIRSKVIGHGETYNVYIHVENDEIEDVSCTCEDYYSHFGTCKHILATAIEFNQNESYIRIFTGENNKNQNDIELYQKYHKQEEKYRNFKQLINTFYPSHNLEEKEQNTKNRIIPHSIKLVPELIYNSYLKTLKLEIKIGSKQLYKIKNFPEFYDRMKNKENYRYGAKLEFIHEKDAFEETSLPILKFILKYSEIIKYANNKVEPYSYYARPMEDRYITVSNTGMDELFEIFKNTNVNFYKDGIEENLLFLNQEPRIKFNIAEEGSKEYKLTPNIDIYGYDLIEGRDNLYFKLENTLYKCSENFKQTTLKLLQVFRENFTNQIIFPKKEIAQIFSIVFPKVKEQIETKELKQEEIEKYIPKDLFVKVYLDYNESNYITADIKFIYGEEEFNPLLEQNLNIPRDLAKEDETLEIFRKSGFMIEVEKARLILASEEAIYNFLETDIETYMKKFEVLATDSFKQKEIRRPKIGTLGVRVENNLLNLDLQNIDFDINELKEIMQKYHLKKKYHRLKDGSFLNLEENETFDFIEGISKGMDISYKELEKGQIHLPMYRSLYLDRLLKNVKGTNISKNKEYKDLVSKVEQKNCIQNIELPQNLNTNLRNYQKTGYEWLKVLDSYKFGGILADDMGLRENSSTTCNFTRLYTKYHRPKAKYCCVPKFTYTKLAERNTKIYSKLNFNCYSWK